MPKILNYDNGASKLRKRDRGQREQNCNYKPIANSTEWSAAKQRGLDSFDETERV